MSERNVFSILGMPIGTATGWDQYDDWAIILYEVEPYEGFSMPSGDLVVDYETGLLTQFDDAGNITDQKNLVVVLNGYIARQHHNKKKLANANVAA